MKKNIKIGLFQLDSSYEMLQKNLDYIEKKISKNSKLDIFILGELFNTGYDLKKVKNRAENQNEILQFVKKITKKYSLTSIFGSLGEVKNGKLYNSSYYIDNGSITKKYKKIHLFTLTGEDKYFSSGSKIQIVEYKGWKIGLSICYDLRFPELFVQLRKNDVDLFVLPANWPQKRIDHWLNLNKSRAIENQAYMIAVNRVGIENNIKFGGNSVVFSPWGECLINMKMKKGFKSVNLNYNIIKESRAKLNSFRDRKPEIYN